MRVFNLAEELEKERKKNKELQGNIDDLVNSNCQLNEYIEQLDYRINKAIEYIKESYNFPRGCGVEPLEEMYGERIIDILKGNEEK